MSDSPVNYDPFRSGEIARTVPSTEPQREIISSALLGDIANAAFNEAVSLTLPGTIEVEKIREALEQLVARHEALRSTFTRTGDEMCVSSEASFEFTEADVSDLDEAALDAGIQDIWKSMVSEPLDLFDGPLFRTRLVRLPDGRQELILLAHHIVCDGWSFAILIEELLALLEGESLPEASQSFADFAERQRAEESSNADIDFWLDAFSGDVPDIDLPTDRPRPAQREFAAIRTDFELDAESTAAVRDLARACRASVVQTAFAATAVLVQKLSRSPEVVIGMPVARQGTDGLDRMVGHAVQLLPIRVAPQPEQSFADLVKSARARIIDAQEHPNFTFGSLVRELGIGGDPARVPMIPVIFNIDQAMGELTIDGQPVVFRPVPRVAENFEIFLNVTPTDSALRIEATHGSTLFDPSTVTGWMQALEQLLLAASSNPDASIADLWAGLSPPVVVFGERDPSPQTVWLDAFDSQVNARAGEVACRDSDGETSYRDLEEDAIRLAGCLVADGVKAGDVVAYSLSRGRALLVAMLGIHKAGAAFLPIDLSLPKERRQFLLNDSGASRLIVDAPTDSESGDVRVFDLAAVLESDVPDAGLPAVNADDDAYIIYTSGSTGVPKGVVIQHGALANFLFSMQQRPGFEPDDSLLAVTTTSFDISVLELLLPLYSGGSVYIASREQASDSRSLQELMATHAISVL